jgi:hypothetical protein
VSKIQQQQQQRKQQEQQEQQKEDGLGGTERRGGWDACYIFRYVILPPPCSL